MLCLVVGAIVVAPTAQGAGPEQYSAPEWMPLRHDVNGGGIKVGCTYASPDGLCAGHHGYWAIDFLGSTGSPVYAAGAGLAADVTGSGYEGYGNVVVVDHGSNGKSLYAHLNEVLVGRGGQWVDENTLIGRIGSSGGANTPHLHYEESSSSRFGSAGSRDPGPMKACRAGQLVTYPEAFGFSGWRGLSWGSGSVESDGTGCAVLSGVAEVLGATVATGVTAVNPVAKAAPDQGVAADFNGDGFGDVGFRNSTTGLFTMRNGPSFTAQGTYPWATGTNYQPLAADFNGDGMGDIGVRDARAGMIFIKHGPTFADQITYQWTASDRYQVLAADFNADRQADIGLRDTVTGLVSMRSGPTFASETTFQSVAGPEYQVVAADFNSDRMADIGFRNSGTGAFAVNFAPTFAGQRTFASPPGAAFQALATDFNNDGVADLGLKGGGVAALDIKHGPAFTDQVTTPFGPQLDPLASLLAALFAPLAARPF